MYAVVQISTTQNIVSIAVKGTEAGLAITVHILKKLVKAFYAAKAKSINLQLSSAS